MTESPRCDVVAEQHVRDLSERITAPHARECLLCFLRRMVAEFGCDSSLRWAKRWHAAQPRRPRGLLRRLQRDGGYCDCEVLMNVYQHHDIDAPFTDDAPPCPHRR